MLEVWAPHATRVEADLNGRRIALEPGAGGWHRSADELCHGDRYAFRLDGGEPLPDPRSPHQPDGVHAASAWVDHSLFDWRDAGWQAGELRDQVIYELHVGTFTPGGTFESAIERLDHIVELGATAVELMPVAEFSGERGWGYDGVDLFAPHHAYGGPDGLKRLVGACHARGLAVVMDVVYNHVGPEGNYLPRFGPYFSDRYDTDWGSAFNFDGDGADEVRRFVIDNALSWLRDYHCDGLRLDAVHAIFDESSEHVLDELAAAVRSLERSSGRRLWVIEESGQRAPRPELDGHWCDDFHHALHACLTGERAGYYKDFGSVATLAEALVRGYVRIPVVERPERLVVCAQNHDQVGNRARGDRLRLLVTPGLLRCAAALTLTAPYVPLIFMGEEWGASTPFQFFSDHRDPAIAKATTEGRIREFAAFGWAPDEVPDPQAAATFERSKLRWDELKEPSHRELFDWHRELIALRRSRSSLRGGSIDVEHSEEPRRLRIDRGEVRVEIDLGAGSVSLDVKT